MMKKALTTDVLGAADAATNDIRVVMFSARGAHSDRRVGLELGADDFID